jgi:hypothetical protein
MVRTVTSVTIVPPIVAVVNSYTPLSASLCGYFVTCFNVKYVIRGTCIYSPLNGELQNETLLLTKGCIRIKYEY